MEMTQKKELIKAYVIRLKKAIEKEKFIKKELENDKATLKYLTGKKNSGEHLDSDVYESYDEWIENIRKQILVSETTLTNIDFKKIEVEALEVFLAA